MSTSVTQPAAPLAVLIERLEWHIDIGNAAGLLHGLTWHFEPTWKVEGIKDLPNLTVIEFTDQEANFAGAVKGVDTKANTIIAPVQVVTFMLSVRKAYGLFNRTGGNPKGLLDWASRVRDAMEIDGEVTVAEGVTGVDATIAQLDSRLRDTCLKPFTTLIRDNVVRDVAWSIGIEVTLYPRETIRGTRNDPMLID